MSIYKYTNIINNINNNIYLDKTLETWYNLNKSKNIHLFKEVVNIWDEMSYNYYWAYREVDFRDRLNTEPDFQDMEYDYESEDLYISES